MRSFRWSVVLVMCSTLAACGGATPAATVAPVTVESTPPVQGTPPGFPTVVEQSVVTNPLVIALLALLDWVAPPHYSQCDRLIVLYLGSEARVVEALSELCAPPFYTANAPFAPAATAGR